MFYNFYLASMARRFNLKIDFGYLFYKWVIISISIAPSM